MGPLRIDGRLSEITGRCDARDTVFASYFRPMPDGRDFEGMSEVGHFVDFGTSSVVAILNRGADPRIRRLIVTDPAIRTEREIGPESTVGDIRRAHDRLCAGTADGVATVFVDSLRGVWFHTSVHLPDSIRMAGDPGRAAEAIPDSATIRMVSIQYQGRACVLRAPGVPPAVSVPTPGAAPRRLRPDSVSPSRRDSATRRPPPPADAERWL